MIDFSFFLEGAARFIYLYYLKAVREKSDFSSSFRGWF